MSLNRTNKNKRGNQRGTSNHDAITSPWVTRARQILEEEARGIRKVGALLDSNFDGAVRTILRCRGRIIVTGLGKSGHVGRKIAATLASTGSTALFLHAGEALHGDLGMITRDDIVIAVSQSGDTAELMTALRYCHDRKVPIIGMAANPKSRLAKMSDYFLSLQPAKEVDCFRIVPTGTATATLALGDALAVVVMEKRRFSLREFHERHPGGTLGKIAAARLRSGEE
jgi:arabinose-5-phosphate isomerase